MYWRGLCRPERGQRGHTESHSWLVSLVRTRRETETEVTLVPTATVKDWKLSAFKLKEQLRKRKRDLLVESRSLAGTVVIIREGKLEQITLKL